MEAREADTKTTPMTPPGIHEYAFEAGHILCARFQILEPLGHGGAGEVYRARDVILNEEVALKVVLKGKLPAHALDRVSREVSAARNLSHANILKYYDLHDMDDGLAISMELIKGETLQQKLTSEGPMGEEMVRGLLPQLADAMEELHRCGLIHRDIKPSNIFVTKDGLLKLGDFGIVHVEDADDLTKTGETLGTPTYMSPEQIQGRPPLTPASDYYSLGVTLYELVSGKVPFEGTYGDVASGHIHKVPAVLGKKAGSRRLRNLIQGLLIKDPARRWGKRELDRFLEGGRLPLTPAWRSRMKAGLAMALLIAGLGFLGKRMIHPAVTPSFNISERKVECLIDGKVKWTKTFEYPVEGYTLFDTDGDGEKEVLFNTMVRLIPGKNMLKIPVYKKSGMEAPPILVDVKGFNQVFSDYSHSYYLIIKPISLAGNGRQDLLITLHHEYLFPSLTAIWSSTLHSVAFSLGHPGQFFKVVPWRGSLAMFGAGSRYLHMTCLILLNHQEFLDQRCIIFPGKTNALDFHMLKAYYLLENESGTSADVADGITITLGDGSHRLMDDGRLQGQAPGAAGQSIHAMIAVEQIREHFSLGKAGEALGLIAEAREKCVTYGLVGHAVLFDILESEAYARLGRWEEAQDLCSKTVQRHPAYTKEVPIISGFYLYLQGKYDAARRQWLGNPGNYYVGSGKQYEIYTYVVFASLLSGMTATDFNREVTAYQRICSKQNYWEPFLEFQKGWEPLFHGMSSAALGLLKPALVRGGFEPHAAGYFLACLACGKFDIKEFDAYAGVVGGNPIYLQWIGALARHDKEKAAVLWSEFENDAYGNQDSALMLPVIKKIRDLYHLGIDQKN